MPAPRLQERMANVMAEEPTDQERVVSEAFYGTDYFATRPDTGEILSSRQNVTDFIRALHDAGYDIVKRPLLPKCPSGSPE